MGALRQAIRRGRQRPVVTATVVATLALGVGLNAAVFSAVYGALIRPLPYPAADRLVVFTDAPAPDASGLSALARFSFGEVPEWPERSRTLAAAAGFTVASYAIRSGVETWFSPAAVVTDDFFSVLGTPPRRGRTWLTGGQPTEAVVSERLARLRLGGLGTAVGRGVSINGVAFTVVGVLPDSVGLPQSSTDIWLPSRAAALIGPLDLASRTCVLIGRLREGVTREQAQDDATRVSAEIGSRWPSDRSATLIAGLQDALTRDVRRPLAFFALASLLVLAVGVINLSLLLVSEVASQQRALAVRKALGASPARLLAESIAGIGATCGLAALLAVPTAWACLHALARWQPALFVGRGATGLDAAALGSGLVLATLTALVIGALAGAAAARSEVNALLAGPAGRSSPAAGGLRDALLSSQIALSVFALVVAGALLARVQQLLTIDPGVDAGNAVVMRLSLPGNVYPTPDARRGFLRELLRRAAETSGVEQVGIGGGLPPGRSMGELTMVVPDDSGGSRRIEFDYVPGSPGYLPALGLRLRAGRGFTDADSEHGAPVVILSSRAARALLGSQDPLGQRIRTHRLPMDGAPHEATVVGIVDDVRYRGLEAAPEGAVYAPIAQEPLPQLYLVARNQTGAAVDAGALVALVRQIDPMVAVNDVQRVQDAVLAPTAQPRFRLAVLGTVATSIVLLTTVGVFGLTRQILNERRRELAIRIALGAAPRQVVRLVTTRAALVLLAGGATGAVSAWAARVVINGAVADAEVSLAGSIAGAMVLQSAVVVIATFMPAWRWTRDPAPLRLLTRDS